MNILLIDDEEFTRLELGEFLQDEGYNVITASDGIEGIKLFQEKHPEIVLTDVKMPKMDGFTVLKKIKAQKPETRVLLLTGHGDEEMVIRALKEGANDYIKKPINLNYLSESMLRASESVKSLKRTTFNASSVLNVNQTIKIDNNLDTIYAVTNYITNLNYVYFNKAACEKIKLALIESLRNSIEHGNLEIDYEEKNKLLEEGKFNEELRNRLNNEYYKNRQVTIKYFLDNNEVRYTIEDQGKGFNWKKLPNLDDPQNIFKRNGRGIMLIKLMMDDTYFNEKGNVITLVKKCDHEDNNVPKNVWISHYIQNKHDLR
jgi:DNA-binding response OmpR family regulator